MKILTKGFIILFLQCMAIKLCYADIGIIVALNSSLTQLKNDLKIVKISQGAKREFYSGLIDNINVVIVRSPMGKVNNAITTQFLLSNFSIDIVISMSPAGSIDSNLNIGDIVIASKVLQHDFGTIKPYGFIWSKVPDGTSRDEPGYDIPDKFTINSGLFYADKNLKSNKNTVVSGVIVSGDQFISALSKKEWLLQKFQAKAVDMGAGAIAQVCFANNIPFCIIRVITDKAGVSARTDFIKSVRGYHSDINVSKFLKAIFHGIQSKKWLKDRYDYY
ncbi:MAG: 5'-methylthioadenosine/adenosylhomocysteine nucleosidase [Desulfobacula sp.]|uniref:5'-methylthioadenosine/adenosylhomocysteine nucleosidase n=1 Tax=Desulfobacula sp. TaxID=2593537 RepID=UPI0025C1030B|nr:5'-methylthioadenosine/adenosylhomocysteine nucleosidase [Desulfobacula sp.]MCD4719840.1 5'-methylthioadenosine/adenosylhomocysteine nucleosidase [Desulfobacula sp.]